MSLLHLFDLPDEIILKILSYLETKDIILCGHVSKRMRYLSYDEILWQKINLYEKKVPSDFLERVSSNGCKYLSLQRSRLRGNLSLPKQSHFIYLNLSFFKCSVRNFEELLASCHSLLKLSLMNLSLSSNRQGPR